MFKRCSKCLHYIEDSCLVLSLLALISMSVLQVILRNSGFSGFIWFDSASRILVLWMALLGAMRAARLQNHIAIDLVSHYASPVWHKRIHFIVSLAGFCICLCAAYFSFRFVQSEFNYPSNAFLNFPSWLAQSIIPFSLALIGLRFLLFSLSPITDKESMLD